MEIARSRSASRLPASILNNPLNNYILGELLGQGQFGKVYKAHRKLQSNSKSSRNGETFAAKIIPASKLKKNKKVQQLLINEVEILSKLTHSNIIKLEQMFIWEDKVYMIYEYCDGGDLEEMLPISQTKAIDIFRKIVKACNLAQKYNILHRDLKPANILFKNGEPKVADWGFSRFLNEELTASSFVGSPAYMAPELLKGHQYTNKADVWSFGVMVYESIFNQMPWPAKNINDLLHKVNTPLRFPHQIMTILQTIIKMSLQVNPQKRASFQKLLKYMDNSKIVRTEEKENPEDMSVHQQLSQHQIRKCSFYLEYAKKSQKFQNTDANEMCLELVLQNLRKIKAKTTMNLQKSQMSPCASQRKMSLTKREINSPRTSSKILHKQYVQTPQTHTLLEKQIFLIEKIKKSLVSISSPTKNLTIQSQKPLIRQILKNLIKNISIYEKSETSSRKQLIQTNCILQTIMFQHLTQQAKTKKLSEKIKQMQSESINSLIRSVNHRILYVNQHFCKD